jgi:hypothetical protein
MTSVLDEPRSQSASAASDRLRAAMAAARLSFNWLGVRKSLSSSQKDQAADSFGAEGKYLSAGKKLLDTSHPAFKAVTSIRGQTIAYWKGISLPFPEPGIRLIRQGSIDEFNDRIAVFGNELDEAVQLAEQAFIEELARLVDHLSERLSGSADGKPKVFRDSAVTNMAEFFERFRSLNVRSNEQLDELVGNAQRVVSGVEPQDLRDSQALRQTLSTQMAAVQAGLDQLLVDRPRRNIQRRPR